MADTDSLRIALIIPAFLPATDYGGPVVKLRALAHGLLELGHRPEVWCADFGPERSRVAAGPRIVDGIPVRYLRRVLTFRWSPVVPQAALVGARSEVDVGHCFGLRDGLTFFAAAGLRARRVPYVVEPLGMYPPSVRRFALKRAFDLAITDRFVAASAGLIANSELERGRLGPAFRLRIWVRLNPLAAPQPVCPDPGLRTRLGVPEGAHLVGWIGRISQSKGLDVLVEAVARIPRLHAIIAGPDDGDGALSVLTDAIRSFGVRDRVHIVGATWGAERDRLLASFDLFVLPSVTESFGNAAAEAALAGVPVLMSDRCGAAVTLSEFDAATIVPLSADAFAAAISEVLNRGSRGPSSGVPATRLREALSPRTVAAKQVGIYNEALARARRATRSS